MGGIEDEFGQCDLALRDRWPRGSLFIMTYRCFSADPEPSGQLDLFGLHVENALSAHLGCQTGDAIERAGLAAKLVDEPSSRRRWREEPLTKPTYGTPVVRYGSPWFHGCERSARWPTTIPATLPSDRGGIEAVSYLLSTASSTHCKEGTLNRAGLEDKALKEKIAYDLAHERGRRAQKGLMICGKDLERALIYLLPSVALVRIGTSVKA